MNKIILTAEADFIDKDARKEITKLFNKINEINERTKRHTLDIKDLNKRLKENE